MNTSFNIIFRRGMARSLGARGLVKSQPKFGLDGTYATALFKAAIKTSSLESVSHSLSRLSSHVSNDHHYYTNVKTLPESDRIEIAKKLIKTDDSMERSIKSLIKVLATNNSLELIPKISTSYNTLL
ncbi:hypothetical protein Kpol_1023p46 [Vanderwaltozyma polyspora DSM 70294]|uniref:ATP synthase subunit 5, mitochondrial n=1 Tax=Vanderwaltozyma polyspora (strain ATCC 22028 / DSM 70294 / BCRC 21397 / CBS 2163 / NBRC 10782 / NRRL Y-8283 / UCD 57-17) TaxID=436907 RepID=A7TFR9_VANPO|nr:uncharacterized protein Kpol_1023p46 [Vanderwaltozyma polyspora DSM 70294]EDO18877.1 hypothetical protein Kpol_1023p46 [Vanderwaltozyma polyspora DSM 70294]